MEHMGTGTECHAADMSVPVPMCVAKPGTKVSVPMCAVTPVHAYFYVRLIRCTWSRRFCKQDLLAEYGQEHILHRR